MTKSKDFLKEFSRLKHEVEKLSRPDHCILCGKRTDGLCNSHTVPQFILREIAENGNLFYGQAIHRLIDSLPINVKTGIRNAFPFRLICKKCDKDFFSHYEDPSIIDGFSNLEKREKDQVLTEMAIKTHLSYLSMKLNVHHQNLLLFSNELLELHRNGKKSAYEIDIEDHLNTIADVVDRLNKDVSPFEILYDRLLDYKTGIATQSLIAYMFDLKGKLLFNPKDFTQINKAPYFYLMILPYQGKTRIIFYIEKEKIGFVKQLLNDFGELKEDDKLHFIFISLIIYTEQFFLSPSLCERIKKDRRIVALYTNTDGIAEKSCKRIKYFRRYKNYLEKDFAK